MVRAQQRSAAITDAAERAPARLDDERAYLYQIIQTIGSGPDLEAILGGVVRLATQATACHACLIWFLDGDRLVLRVVLRALRASRRRREHGARRGLVGWVVKTRRSTFIKEQALEDPRVKYFPEFEEERFQSLVSVPMFDRDGGVMGVISLHAEAPHEFVRSRPGFPRAHRVADRRARSRTPGSTRRPRRGSTLLTDLSSLLQRIAGATTIERRVRHGHRGHAAAAERGSRGGLPRRRRQAAPAPRGEPSASRRPEHRHADAVVRRAPRPASP